LEASRPTSLVHSGDPPWAQSLLFLALLVSYALFFNLVGTWLAGKVYRSSYSRLYDEPRVRRSASTWWLDGALARGAVFLPRDVRLLLVKDFRLFRRDPVQWSQFLIFFGLLGLYFSQIRRFSYHRNYSAMIGFLNLAVVGLILSTFTTRFIYPMVSLEGRRLWILGLLPIRRDSVLWAKFLFAAVGSLVPCTLLVLMSDLMLQIEGLWLVVHQLSCIVLCIGLSAIAVGLGAKMPDLRAHSPSKIAAGFGGTLNLVVSAGYIVVVVLLTALPVHLHLAMQQENTQFGDEFVHFLGSRLGVAAGISLTVLVGAIATIWPMRVGLRAFRRLEF
jgi:ABC-2 type transport system permease protein